MSRLFWGVVMGVQCITACCDACPAASLLPRQPAGGRRRGELRVDQEVQPLQEQAALLTEIQGVLANKDFASPIGNSK